MAPSGPTDCDTLTNSALAVDEAGLGRDPVVGGIDPCVGTRHRRVDAGVQGRHGLAVDRKGGRPDDLAGDLVDLARAVADGVPALSGVRAGRNEIGRARAADDLCRVHAGDRLDRRCLRHGERTVRLSTELEAFDVLLEGNPIHRRTPTVGHDHVARRREGAGDAGQAELLAPARLVHVDAGRRQSLFGAKVRAVLVLAVEPEGLAEVDLGSRGPQQEEPDAADGDEHQYGKAHPRDQQTVVVDPVHDGHLRLSCDSVTGHTRTTINSH